MRRVVLTDERGVAVLMAAGLPCEQLWSPPADAAAAPPPAQMSLGEVPTINTRQPMQRPGSDKKATHVKRWLGFAYVKLGPEKPAPGVDSSTAWAWHRVREHMEANGIAMMLKSKALDVLAAKYQERHGKSCSSQSSMMTSMLDNKWLEPVRE